MIPKVKMPPEGRDDEWLLRSLFNQPMCGWFEDEFRAAVWVRPTRTLDELKAKAPVVDRWVRRCCWRKGIALGESRGAIIKPGGDPTIFFGDPIPGLIGSLGVKIAGHRP